MAVCKTAIPAEPEPTQTFRVILKGMVIKMNGEASAAIPHRDFPVCADSAEMKKLCHRQNKEH